MDFTSLLKWLDVVKTIIYLKEKDIDITDSCFKNYCTSKTSLTNKKLMKIGLKNMQDKWLNFFQKLIYWKENAI